MVDDINKATQKEALDLVAKAKGAFESLPKDEQENRRTVGNDKTRQLRKFSFTTVACPACGSAALLAGKRIRSSEARLKQDVIVQEHSFLPVKLSCPTCGLVLDGHGLLHAAGVGGQFTSLEEHDPVEFHGIDPYELVDPGKIAEMYFEPEYGND